jgi:hypothetical protein
MNVADVCQALEQKLDDKQKWQVKLRALCGIECLVNNSVDDAIHYFIHNPNDIIRIHNTAVQDSVKAKSKKVLELLHVDTTKSVSHSVAADSSTSTNTSTPGCSLFQGMVLKNSCGSDPNIMALRTRKSTASSCSRAADVITSDGLTSVTEHDVDVHSFPPVSPSTTTQSGDQQFHTNHDAQTTDIMDFFMPEDNDKSNRIPESHTQSVSNVTSSSCDLDDLFSTPVPPYVNSASHHHTSAVAIPHHRRLPPNITRPTLPPPPPAPSDPFASLLLPNYSSQTTPLPSGSDISSSNLLLVHLQSETLKPSVTCDAEPSIVVSSTSHPTSQTTQQQSPPPPTLLTSTATLVAPPSKTSPSEDLSILMKANLTKLSPVGSSSSLHRETGISQQLVTAPQQATPLLKLLPNVSSEDKKPAAAAAMSITTQELQMQIQLQAQQLQHMMTQLEILQQSQKL